MLIRKTSLDAIGEDVSPVSGADAVALVHRLTQESWALAGRAFPTYRRADIPVRFVPGFGE